MKYTLGIDFGGGSSKATLLSCEGKIVATASSEYETFSFENGGREQNPNDWVKSAIENIKNIIKNFSIKASDIVCLCFDAATHTAVLMDENFNVIRNSIYWTDCRSIKQSAFLNNNFSQDIKEKFKHSVSTVWTLSQLLWIKENEPTVYKKIKKITFAKDYVRHYFTGDFVTDYIEAEGSLFFDFNSLNWSKKYLDLLEIDESFLPKIVKPQDEVGFINEKIAKETGLQVGTKVVCGTTDTAMEVFASGAVKNGQSTVKLATAGRFCLITDNIIPQQCLVSYSHIKEGLYYVGTGTKACASSLRWFRDTFDGDFETYSELAENIPIGSDGLMFHPYLNGELSPFTNPNVRGSFTGISFEHTKAHFIRSIMEGVALSLADCKEYLTSLDFQIPQKAFMIGGSSKSKVWRQIIADVLNMEMVVNENNDSSFGSAILAGVSAGFFNSIDEALSKCLVVKYVTKPIAENVKKYNNLFRKYKKIEIAIRDLYND